MPLNPATATRLEKSALDNGFDRGLGEVDGWMAFASTHAPVQVWLSAEPDGRPLVALSRQDVAQGLAELGAAVPIDVPSGATDVLNVENIPTLGRLLRRAFQLARSLPTALLKEFQQETATLPRATEAERLVVQRVGQDIFRAGLMEYWEGRCAITGLAVPELLRASHIKPWADCETDAERLDVFNGLLLAPHLDAVFDLGFITVTDDGAVLVSRALHDDARRTLGLGDVLRVHRLGTKHRHYLSWHQEKLFKG